MLGSTTEVNVKFFCAASAVSHVVAARTYGAWMSSVPSGSTRWPMARMLNAGPDGPLSGVAVASTVLASGIAAEPSGAPPASCEGGGGWGTPVSGTVASRPEVAASGVESPGPGPPEPVVPGVVEHAPHAPRRATNETHRG